MDKLTDREKIRYSRHLALENFGNTQQIALKRARVLVIGAGGLGSPILLYLAAAGIGTLGVVDGDKVEESNLQRQVLFTVEDIGAFKSERAAQHLQLLNPLVGITAIAQRLTSLNAIEIISAYDLVIDGSDNFPTRYLVNDACILCGKPLVYGSILEYEGQVAVFNFSHDGLRWSANYRDLFPTPPPPGTVQNCAEAGVLGVLPGVIGSLMANEAIKIITGIAAPLADKLLLVDSLSLEFRIIKYPDKKTREEIKVLMDYDDFCGVENYKANTLVMKEIDVHQLQQLKEEGTDFQLIDVREPHERDICEIGGELIPMSQIPDNLSRITHDKQVVIYCRSGKRSGDIVNWLEKNHGFENLYNLKGGILAWAREIDPEMEQY